MEKSLYIIFLDFVMVIKGTVSPDMGGGIFWPAWIWCGLEKEPLLVLIVYVYIFTIWYQSQR